jgi:hypothetical protein
MSKAGSALMGIGRASGENRAIEAAKQAIESPLLEVSIDGARGILFNVIGGNDLTMHEINSAAETITTASDPEANIIFGATINPELDGEVIITVVATGFDASYYNQRSVDAPVSKVTARETEVIKTKQDEKALSEIDMELDEQPVSQTDFSEDTPMPNIWSIGDENSDDKSADDDDVKPLTTTSHDHGSDDSHDQDIVTSDIESSVEEPSFLRRLRRKHKDEEDDLNS